MIIDCGYDETHTYPEDWIFGGANGIDPRADPRWQPTTYEYLDAFAQSVHVTQTPLCDEEALDEFTKVSSFGNLRPVYLQVKRPGEKEHLLPFSYDESTDTVYPMEQSSND